jgi:hypothetical protein
MRRILLLFLAMALSLPSAIHATDVRVELKNDTALCVWKALSAFIRNDMERDAFPAAIVSIQTAGEFLNWHPHLHVLAFAGIFRTDGCFVRSRPFDAAVLRNIFQVGRDALPGKIRRRIRT